MNEVSLFVPGRLCIFGEHSDWVFEFDSDVRGCTIVSGLQQGIYANVKKNDKFIFFDGIKQIEVPMDLDELQAFFSDDYYKYVFSCAYVMLKLYSVSGIELEITKNDLPLKKGLSSSAAICVLVIRAFNQLYDLKLSVDEEMSLAYRAERLIGSKCGKMDQICAYGSDNVCVMNYENGKTNISDINIRGNFYFLLVDLNSSKNTVKILDDLHSAYSENQLLKKYFSEVNSNICSRAIEYLENGDNGKLGQLMIEAQECFDQYCSSSSDEFKAPLLHTILNDEIIKGMTYGGKGVGSQGDGTVQLLVKSFELVEKLSNYIKDEYNMNTYSLSLSQSYKIKSAVIPVAGYGTRMYPMTKVINKEFLPLLDKDKILKPSIAILVEELYDAGIEEIIFLIAKEDIDLYKSLFYKNYEIKCNDSVLEMVRRGEYKFNKISSRIKFIVVEKGIGFANTILCSKKIVGDLPFLLVLGDQLYESNSDMSCTKQLLDFYRHTGNVTISCCPVDIEKSNLYGILKGNIEDKNYFDLIDFVEKPDNEYAYNYLSIDGGNSVLAVFGQYILNKEIFELIERDNCEHITDAIKEIANNSTVNGFIVDGKFFDIGNIDGYCETFKIFYDKNK